MPLWTKCLKCGNWKEMPTDPSGKSFSTGLMMNAPTAPGELCACDDDGGKKDETNQ